MSIASVSFSNAIRGNSIVICGGMDSGKTVLFYYLKSGKFRDTLPSMKENVAEFTISHPDANEVLSSPSICHRHYIYCPSYRLQEGVTLTSLVMAHFGTSCRNTYLTPSLLYALS